MDRHYRSVSRDEEGRDVSKFGSRGEGEVRSKSCKAIKKACRYEDCSDPSLVSSSSFSS